MTTSARAPLVLAVLALIGAAGCAPLPPWQRGTLRRPAMQPPSDPLEAAMDAHVHATREGFEGASSGGGVACGCN
jgi:hypothetical protein